MFLEFICAVVLALVVSLGLNRMMLYLGPILGLMDEPGDRRVHTKPIPRAGGIAIWLAFLLVIGGGLATGLIKQSNHVSWHWLSAFFAGSLVLIVTGFLDDRTGLRPLVKLGAHLLAPSVFFFIHPIETGLFSAHWHGAYDYLVFVIWAVVLINAFNLIDGLDGLCGGLSVMATVALAVFAMTQGRKDAALLLLVMSGAILGFLKYNINPARIFLGDAGSMLMGFFLATAATDAVGRKTVVGMILLPIAVAGVPLLDVLLAVWRRGARRYFQNLLGKKITGGIFDADGEHLHHRLLASGASQHTVAVILQILAVILTALAFLPLVFGQKMFALSLVGFLLVCMIGLRNLARIEIAHTGSIVHLAIKQPGYPRRMAAVLFVYDLLVLVAAGYAAVMIETNWLVRTLDLDKISQYVIIFAIMGSLALWKVRVHRRLWVRATTRDLISLQAWLLIASIAAFSLFSMVYSDLEWCSLRLTMMSCLIACAGVCLPRVILNLIRELSMEAKQRNSKLIADGKYGSIVILGAGDMGALLLDHLKSSIHDLYPGIRVLGFLDETRVLHGRQLRSFQILGGLSMVPKLVKESKLEGIILAIHNPCPELLEQLDELAAEHNLKIYHWSAGLKEMARVEADLPDLEPS